MPRKTKKTKSDKIEIRIEELTEKEHNNLFYNPLNIGAFILKNRKMDAVQKLICGYINQYAMCGKKNIIWFDVAMEIIEDFHLDTHILGKAFNPLCEELKYLEIYDYDDGVDGELCVRISRNIMKDTVDYIIESRM